MNKITAILYGIIGVLLIGLLVTGFSSIQNKSAIDDLRKENDQVLEKIDKSAAKLMKRDQQEKKVRKTLSKSKTGFDYDMINSDAALASNFFKDAFTWRNGNDYDKARNKYIELLGKDNSFTKTYLIEPIKIDTKKGKMSEVDVMGMKSKYDSMYIIPLRSAGENTVRYLGFVTYHVYKKDDTEKVLDELDPVEGIIEFTVTGNDEGRKISNVKAYPGFAEINE